MPRQARNVFSNIPHHVTQEIKGDGTLLFIFSQKKLKKLKGQLKGTVPFYRK